MADYASNKCGNAHTKEVEPEILMQSLPFRDPGKPEISVEAYR